jgi:hypothetical protein
MCRELVTDGGTWRALAGEPVGAAVPGQQVVLDAEDGGVQRKAARPTSPRRHLVASAFQARDGGCGP